MRDFLSSIKLAISDPRNRLGRHDEVVVGRLEISELIDNFERLDSEARVQQNQKGHAPIEHILRDAIEAVYRKQGKNAETTLLIILDTLQPLMIERQKSYNPIPSLVKERKQNWKF